MPPGDGSPPTTTRHCEDIRGPLRTPHTWERPSSLCDPVARPRQRVARPQRSRDRRRGPLPFAFHELEAYASLGYHEGAFPVAENWARQCLSLPIYPEFTA